MNSAKLRFILGGALCGAILGAVYANYLYGIHSSGGSLFSGTVITPSVDEWESERADSARVQRTAAESQEDTTEVG